VTEQNPSKPAEFAYIMRGDKQFLVRVEPLREGDIELMRPKPKAPVAPKAKRQTDEEFVDVIYNASRIGDKKLHYIKAYKKLLAIILRAKLSAARWEKRYRALKAKHGKTKPQAVTTVIPPQLLRADVIAKAVRGAEAMMKKEKLKKADKARLSRRKR